LLVYLFRVKPFESLRELHNEIFNETLVLLACFTSFLYSGFDQAIGEQARLTAGWFHIALVLFFLGVNLMSSIIAIQGNLRSKCRQMKKAKIGELYIDQRKEEVNNTDMNPSMMTKYQPDKFELRGAWSNEADKFSLFDGTSTETLKSQHSTVHNT
jgi:hypothetical protein